MSTDGVENYGWSNTDGPHSCDYITPEIVEIIGRHRLKKIVDVGSGNGSLCASLQAACDHIVGIEYDKQGYDISVQKHPDIKFYNLGVQDDPATILEEQGRFDAVLSTEVVEHLFSPHLLPQFAAKLLNDDGLLIITTPYHGYLKNLALSIFNKWDHHHTALWHGGHIKFWSRKTLSILLEQNGFEVFAFSGVGRFRYLWKSMVLIARMRQP